MICFTYKYYSPPDHAEVSYLTQHFSCSVIFLLFLVYLSNTPLSLASLTPLPSSHLVFPRWKALSTSIVLGERYINITSHQVFLQVMGLVRGLIQPPFLLSYRAKHQWERETQPLVQYRDLQTGLEDNNLRLTSVSVRKVWRKLH